MSPYGPLEGIVYFFIFKSRLAITGIFFILRLFQKEETVMEQIIKQNTFSRTVFNDSKLGAYYTDPVHATKIGRLFRLQGECGVFKSVREGR